MIAGDCYLVILILLEHVSALAVLGFSLTVLLNSLILSNMCSYSVTLFNKLSHQNSMTIMEISMILDLLRTYDKRKISIVRV